MQDFFKKYEGKQVDVDNGFPASQPYQCTDWVQLFAREYYGFKTLPFLNKENGYPGGGAADAFYNFGAEGNFISPSDVDLVVNDPADKNQVPKQGDFIIFDRNAGNGYAGHIAIFDVLVSHNSFYSYDQNAPKPSVQRVFHSFTGSNGFSHVIGWLTPKEPQNMSQENINTLRNFYDLSTMQMPEFGMDFLVLEDLAAKGQTPELLEIILEFARGMKKSSEALAKERQDLWNILESQKKAK